MSTPVTDQAARRIRRFSAAAWLVGAAIVATGIFAAPWLLPGSLPADGPPLAAGIRDARAESDTDPWEPGSGAPTLAPEAPGSWSGSGDAVLHYTAPAGSGGLFQAAATSEDSIEVSLDDPAEPEYPNHLIYGIGSDESTETFATERGSFVLYVTTDGDWTVSIEELRYLDVNGPMAGTGRAYLRYEGDGAVAGFSNDGDSNVTVKGFQEGGWDLLVNEIGDYRTRFSWQPAPVVFFEIDTHGAWTFEVEE